MGRRSVGSLGVVFALIACGSPAPAPAPTAATPTAAAASPAPASPSATGGTPAVLDPKGTLDAVRSTAAVASAAVTGRAQAAGAKAGTVASASPGSVPAGAAPALTPSAAKYEAQGRRDPFESLEVRVGSERATVASARLTGIIRSTPTALALIETSDGVGYILKPGDTLAEARLVEIGSNMVVFDIAPKPGVKNNRVVLKLPE